MAEISIEKKSGGAPWLWIIGFLLLGLVVWWLAMSLNPATRTATVAPTPYTTASPYTAATPYTAAPTGGAVAATAALPLAAMRANPDAYFGQEVSGLGRVSRILGTRTFLLEQDGTEVYVITDPNAPAIIQNSAGKNISLTGTVRNPDGMQQWLGNMNEIDAATLQSLQGEPAVIYATNLEVQQG